MNRPAFYGFRPKGYAVLFGRMPVVLILFAFTFVSGLSESYASEWLLGTEYWMTNIKYEGIDESVDAPMYGARLNLRGETGGRSLDFMYGGTENLSRSMYGINFYRNTPWNFSYSVGYRHLRTGGAPWLREYGGWSQWHLIPIGIRGDLPIKNTGLVLFGAFTFAPAQVKSRGSSFSSSYLALGEIGLGRQIMASPIGLSISYREHHFGSGRDIYAHKLSGFLVSLVWQF